MTRVWTEARSDWAKQLWQSGWSAGQIGKELGLSRNAVIGRICRMGLSRNEAKPTVHATYPANRKPAIRTGSISKTKIKAMEKPKPIAEPLAPPPRAPVPLMDLEPHHCRWPIGAGEAVLFCGSGRLVGRPYCPRHCGEAYTERQPKRSAA